MEIYEELFPDVKFTDKVEVIYKDGSVDKLKHLYFDNLVLKEIDWDEVESVVEL